MRVHSPEPIAPSALTYLNGLAEQLAALPLRLAKSDLERAGLCVLDALACVYGGRRMPWVAQARAVADAGGQGESTVWAGGGARRGIADAVFANSVGCHSLLHEDTHSESRSHLGPVVVPAALGVGELVGASGTDVLRAVVLGYEAVAQVAATTLDEEFVPRGWRATGVFGPFGAAAAAAHLLGLDHATTVHALRIAASSSAGVCEWARAGTTEVYFEAGSAARAGIVAVLLARAGAPGAASAIEGPSGLRRAFSGLTGPVADAETAPDRLAVHRSSFKAHASCALTQSPIDAAIGLHGRGLDPDAAASVVIHTFSAAAHYPGCDNAFSLDTPIARQMSLQFAVAAALVDGLLEPRRYEGTVDPRLAALAARTRVVVDPAYDRGYPARRDARVELVPADGDADGEIVAGVSGEQVGLTPAGVRDKFRRYADPELGPEAAEEVVGLLDRVDGWTARDLVGHLG